MAKKAVAITKQLCQNALCIIDRGLSNGIQSDGKVCIEYAISIASGTPEDKDGPTCVHPSLRSFKINLNDGYIYDDEAHRAKVLRRIGIAQLGTNKGFSWVKFSKALTKWQDEFVANWNEANVPKVAVTKTQRAIVLNALNTLDSDDLSDAASVLEDLNSEAVSFTAADDLLSDYPEKIDDYVEGIVQILKKMKTPGSKFLYLTEGKKKFKLNAAIEESLKKIVG